MSVTSHYIVTFLFTSLSPGLIEDAQRMFAKLSRPTSKIISQPHSIWCLKSGSDGPGLLPQQRRREQKTMCLLPPFLSPSGTWLEFLLREKAGRTQVFPAAVSKHEAAGEGECEEKHRESPLRPTGGSWHLLSAGRWLGPSPWPLESCTSPVEVPSH